MVITTNQNYSNKFKQNKTNQTTHISAKQQLTNTQHIIVSLKANNQSKQLSPNFKQTPQTSNPQISQNYSNCNQPQSLQINPNTQNQSHTTNQIQKTKNKSKVKERINTINQHR